MSFYEGDSATPKQSYTVQLHTASANIRTGPVRLIPRFNNHIQPRLGSTYFGNYMQGN